MNANLNSVRHAFAITLIALTATAQTYVYQQPMAPSGGTQRPSQLWIDPSGQNDLDSDAIAWEDFQLTQSTVVTRVRWWGEVAPSLGFRISFFNQDPGTIAVQPDMFAPGSGPISEEYYTNATQTPAGSGLYQFEVDLTTPLLFNANTRYFISIVGQTPIPFAYWRWAASSTGPNGTFWWQRGLHMFFHLPESRAVSLASSFGSGFSAAFCFGDGSTGPCPCGNSAASGAGCANSTGAGAVISASGSGSVVADNLVLTTTGLPMFQNGLNFTSSTTIPGVPFGDGRRCVAGQISRFGIQSSGSTGTFVYGPGLSGYSATHFPAANQFLAGAVFAFQSWYRDSAGPCSSTTNLSSAVMVAFTP